MQEEAVLYHPTTAYPFFLSAKRYWLPEFKENEQDPEALTLLFLHATSFHKETWMPTLEAIFKLAASSGSSLKIREAWCLDCPNHGASGHANANILLQPEFFLNFSCERYAQGIYHFLSMGPEQGGKVDFRKRNLVGIGHSLGGVAVTLLQDIEPHFPFSSLVLLEPLISPAGGQHLIKLRELLVKGAYERRDVWPDREKALAALKTRDRTKKWDPRILEIFVKYGIVEHPGNQYPEGRYPGVTLACTRDQEAAMYRDPDGATKPVETLKRLCRIMPVHLILGGIADFIPKRVHKAIIESQPWASVDVIKDAGHLIVQEIPETLGKSIFTALQASKVRSRL
ncbi:Abhydrolase domain-containing protein mpaH [Mycena indigotica]|uniref:Abhydrolase domain-containing protein mpaH n=1 Tax=Mycena indigotica TaxID=2126181 RepID=A0A8H6SNC8_9AGAR|nr:Abhydrolase domain-containing protein mpaH [Mycena indigotica]KAF7300970.1 Abhydrolase domain-containing protein mpaH [Mycena indigotica]